MIGDVIMAVGRGIFCSAILWFLVAISCLQNTSLIGESYWDVPSVCGTAFAVFSPGLQRNVYDIARNRFQPRGRRYLSTRISRYPNSEASFTLTRLVISGDIALNPGPATSDNGSTCCSVRKKQVLINHRAIECDICCYWCHIRCGENLPREYRRLQATRDFHWTCPSCISILKSMPFADVSNLESSFSSCSSHDYDSSSIHYASSKPMFYLATTKLLKGILKTAKWLGDFNCDLLQPEKPPKDGGDLLDILDILNFKCLINSATRVTSSTETLLDLILTNVRRAYLQPVL